LDLLPQKREAYKILKAAQDLSRAGKESSLFYQNFRDLKFTNEGLTAETGVKETLNNLSESLNSINKNLSSAGRQFNSLKEQNLPTSFKAEIWELKEKLNASHAAFVNLKEIFEFLRMLALGKKQVLILFENNNELRATGGFMGTFGDFKISDGKFTSINISSIYDLDGQLREKIAPPHPLLAVNDRWFLRDANWFASFPASAQKISSFYEKTGGETPDVLLALTPQVIEDILKITGPIAMPNYGLGLDAENFLETLQAASTITSSEENKPKQILADFFPLFIEKLRQLNGEQTAAIFSSLEKNLNSKQAVFYSRNKGLQKLAASFNWTGEIKSTQKDYLNLVSSNLNGSKTDLYIDTKISLQTVVQEDGGVINELTVERKNTLPDMEKMRNESFLRIFVPKGSSLLSTEGFDFKDSALTPKKELKKDPDVLAWESKILKDVVTGTLIGEEAGQTFFANWTTLAGGESKIIKLTYKLPFKLKSLDHYSLLVQKQIGSNDSEFNHILNFKNRKVEWKNFEAAAPFPHELSTDIVLNRDVFLGAVFSKTEVR
jgi:hypothetical protein